MVQEKRSCKETVEPLDYRAYRRIAPKVLELVIVSKPVALAFCGRLLLQQPTELHTLILQMIGRRPIELNATVPIVLEQLAFLGDTRSRCELLVFCTSEPGTTPFDDGYPSGKYSRAQDDG